MGKKESNNIYLSKLWRFFTSVKLTVVVLLTLAATSIIGTLIPQNENSAAYVREYGEVFYRLFYALGIFDMYHSWWFQFLLLTLTVNIIVCSADRLSVTWKVIFNRHPSFVLSSFRERSNKEEFIGQGPSSHLRIIFEPFISKKFGYIKVEDTDQGFCIFAEKGRWTRIGVYIVHISVVLLLLGGLAGSMFGFEGFVNIPEGEVTDKIRLRKNNEIHTLDFAIRCDDFNVSFYGQSDMPSEYRSTLAILENETPVLKKNIVVNDPLRYKGISIFQSSYGTMPLGAEYIKGKTITLTITSNETRMVYTEKAVVGGQPVELPENFGAFTLKDYTDSYNFRGHNIGEAFIGSLIWSDGGPIDLVLPPNSKFDKMRGDRFFITVTDYPVRYYTGLQVTKDPGVLIVYTGFIVMIIGIFITFFMSHQRFCVEVSEAEGKNRIMISGTANKNKMGMDLKVKKMARLLFNLAHK